MDLQNQSNLWWSLRPVAKKAFDRHLRSGPILPKMMRDLNFNCLFGACVVLQKRAIFLIVIIIRDHFKCVSNF